MRQKELIGVPTPSCHASCVALSEGTPLLAWFGGTKEGAADVGIYVSRKEGSVWSEPERIASEEGTPHWNPVWFAKGKNVTLLYKAGVTIPGWHTRVMRSHDGARTFSAPAELVEGDAGGRGPVRNKPLLLPSGRVVCPASIETKENWDAFCDLTDETFSSVKRGKNVPLTRGGSGVKGKGVIQPALWRSENGEIHMLLRSTEGFVYRSDSFDEGETWTEARPTQVPNNNSGIDVVRLKDGRLFLALNPVSGNWAARSPMEIWLSEDDGESFAPWTRLEDEPYEYSYPSLAADGRRLYLSYTWRREKIAYWEIDA